MSRQDRTLPVTATISNSPEAAHTIKHVTAEVQATENASGMSMALNNAVQLRNTTNDSEMYSMQTITIARASNAEMFMLQPNESKTITLDIVVNNGESNPTDGIMGHLASITNKVNQNGYKYEIHVSIEVEDITLDPQAHQTLQIL
ncbi:MAG TPA: hypothetical protein VH234_04465 [Candidatus Saccharimonadales bacterium]|nr:hypothetical protein [Candidatus Saccharimonadales bacterium]